MQRRLYVAGHGKNITFCVALTREEAEAKLGKEYRLPDPDDLRSVWEVARLGELPIAEIRKRYGISRQTLHNWRRRAGSDGLTCWNEHQVKLRMDEVKSVVLSMQGERVSVIAKKAGTSTSRVRAAAKELGLEIPSWSRRPSDKELVEIAKGKTWMEFADAVGLKLATLRSYIYARPKLSAAISKVRAKAPNGSHGHGKIDPDKILQLRREGLSAYKIAQILKVEQMSVRHWLQKLNKEASNDQARDQRETADSVAGGDGGAEL